MGFGSREFGALFFGGRVEMRPRGTTVPRFRKRYIELRISLRRNKCLRGFKINGLPPGVTSWLYEIEA